MRIIRVMLKMMTRMARLFVFTMGLHRSLGPRLLDVRSNAGIASGALGAAGGCGVPSRVGGASGASAHRDVSVGGGWGPLLVGGASCVLES